MKAEIGLIGLGVMGKSLSRNLARNGFDVSVFNRHVPGKEENVATQFKHAFPEMENAMAFDNLESFIDSLEIPRKIILMVNAGPAVDAVLDQLKVKLDSEDVIIDTGNSHFKKTTERMSQLKEKGIFLIGTGVSGGELGALNGPSIMPSGEEQAYHKIQNYLETIAAKDADGLPCCTYVGKGGSGHFVKMIHNGIEYAEMQLLAECYFMMKHQAMTNEEIADVFESWTNRLNSYLLRISIHILRKKEGGAYLLDLILDQAGNKGTGKWATMTISDAGQSATMIPAALFARYLSFFKAKRQEAHALFSSEITRQSFQLDDLEKAYGFARIINHHQGFELMAQISDQNNWQINLSEVARIWTEGCIIKSDLIKKLTVSLKSTKQILFEEPWISEVKNSINAAKKVAQVCLNNELHIPCMLEALNYFNGLKTANCSANLIQAQRDYFGAHTYQKKNDPSQASYHTEW